MFALCSYATVQPEELTFKVEQWDITGNRLESVLARASNQLIARGAFQVAARLYPRSMITLRQGIRVIETTERT